MSAQPDDLARWESELKEQRRQDNPSEPIGWVPLGVLAFFVLLGFCIIGLAFDVAVHLLSLLLGAL